MSAVTAVNEAPPKSESPLFERLATDAFEACDGHSSGSVAAIVTMLLPNGGLLYLCGHHARGAGFEHTDSAPAENRTQGSDH